MGLKLEVGKHYKTRDGRKVGPVKNSWNTAGHFCWHVDSGSCSSVLWDEYGCSGITCDTDLIALWQDDPTGPVRTVTRTTREIVDGKYGHLDIGHYQGQGMVAIKVTQEWHSSKGVSEDHAVYDAAGLSDLIANLTAIRDALEDQ